MFSALCREQEEEGQEVTSEKPTEGKRRRARKRAGREGDYRSVVEDQRKRIEQFARAPDGQGGGRPLVLGGDLNALEKRLLAAMARLRYGLSTTEDCGPKRTVHIVRPADWAQRRQEAADAERRTRRLCGGRPRPLTAGALPVALRNRFGTCDQEW